MPRTDKLSGYKTTITTRQGITPDKDETVVTYHSTEIVRFTNDYVILNFNGWDTVTTRRKMNQASKQFGLGYGVYRDKGQTYIRHGEFITALTGNVVVINRLNSTTSKGD